MERRGLIVPDPIRKENSPMFISPRVKPVNPCETTTISTTKPTPKRISVFKEAERNMQYILQQAHNCRENWATTHRGKRSKVSESQKERRTSSTRSSRSKRQYYSLLPHRPRHNGEKGKQTAHCPLEF